MLKSVLKKEHLEEQLAFAPPAIRQSLQHEYKKVTNNLQARLLANTSILPNKQVPTKVGTGKYKPPEVRSLMPRTVKGTKRTFVILN